MGFSFVTTTKIKSFNSMNASYRHNLRIYQPKNADIEKAGLNDELIKLNGQTYKNVWDDKIDALKEQGTMGKNLRKDAVLGIEVLMTFSRTDMDHIDIEQWKRENVAWLNKTFNAPDGSTNNVVSAMFHGDETGNVHIHAFVIPVTQRGTLSAKEYLDRPKLREMQNSYGELMSQKFGLQRGKKNSVAKHEDIRKFYSDLNHVVGAQAPLPEKDESLDDYYTRVTGFFQEKEMQHFQAKTELKHKVDDARTETVTEIMNIKELNRKTRKNYSKIEKMLHLPKNYLDTHELDTTEAEKKIKSFDALQRGIKKIEDKEYAQKLKQEINTLIKTEREAEKKADKKVASAKNKER